MTCWPKIAQMEEELKKQNPEFLIKFIQELASQNLLTEYMLSAIANATHVHVNSKMVWSILHRLADKEIQ